MAIWELSRPSWFYSVGGEVLVENVAQFLQPGEEFPRVLAVPVGQVGETVHNELVIGGGGEFSFEKRPDPSPCFLGRS